MGHTTTAFQKLCLLPWCFGAKRPHRLDKVTWSQHWGMWGSGSRTCCSLRWSPASSSVCHNDKWGRHGETVEGGRQVRGEACVLRCIQYSQGMYVHRTENANKCVWVCVCDNDRLSPHGDVEPEPALILIHYLYFPRLAVCANRTQHTHGRHTNGDGACGDASFTGQCLTLTVQNEPIYRNNNMTKYRDGKKKKKKAYTGQHFILMAVTNPTLCCECLVKNLTFAVWYFIYKIISRYSADCDNNVSGSESYRQYKCVETNNCQDSNHFVSFSFSGVCV